MSPWPSLCTLLIRRDSTGEGAKHMTTAKPSTRVRAEAKITVHNSEAKPYDQSASPALTEICLRETFIGDIDGESTVRAFTGPTRRSLCQPRQHATFPRKAGRTPGHV